MENNKPLKYKLIVLSYSNNPEYEAEMAKYKEKNRGMYDNNRLEEPREVIPETSLEVILSPEQYDKVKEGVLTVFK